MKSTEKPKRWFIQRTARDRSRSAKDGYVDRRRYNFSSREYANVWLSRVKLDPAFEYTPVYEAMDA